MSLQAYTPYTYSRGFNSGEFHHAVLSISGTTHTLYLDGSAVAVSTGQPNIFASYSQITNTIIGAQPSFTQAFQGIIGDVRVYNYASSSTQVSNLYLNRNLVVHYPFDTVVNNRTPNYGTMVYDASFIGVATNYSPGHVGTSSLQLTNTAGSTATQYVYSKPGIPNQATLNLNATTGLTISCWVNTNGYANRVQRLFEICTTAGTNGLSLDISGTNMIYSTSGIISLNILSGSSSFSVSSAGKTYYVFTSGTYTFTGPDISINYLMVGGGGTGGPIYGGGGGAGSVILGNTTITSGTVYTLTVGSGGTIPEPPVNGGNSTLSTSGTPILTAYGGGYGGGVNYAPAYNANTTTNNGTMGSGGGGSGYTTPANIRYAGGTTNMSNGIQITNGYAGGYANLYSANPVAGGGGGGGGAGQGGFASPTTGIGGVGGNGITSATINTICSAISTNMNGIVPNWSTLIVSASNYYLGGGGGGGSWGVVAGTASGGLGGGGTGATNNTIIPAIAGIKNTGGGGGGGAAGGSAAGAVGGSGLVVIYF